MEQQVPSSRWKDQISQDCEYFTQVVLRNSRSQEIFYDTNSKNESGALNVQAASQLIVQASYLCYYCYHHRIPLEIDPKQDIMLDARQLTNPEPQGVAPLLRYSLSGEPMKSIKAFLVQLLSAILSFCDRLTPLATIPSLSCFSNDLEFIKAANFPEEKDFFFALEETVLFRTHCMALRLMNSFFMHLMQKDKELLQRFFECRKKQAELVTSYLEAKKTKQQAKVQELSNNINTLIRQFFCGLGNLSGCRCTKSDSEGINEVKLCLHLKEKDFGLASYMKKFNGKEMSTEKTDFKPSELEYLIEYNGQRNTLIVRLITDFKMTVEQGDFLLFQLNRLTYDSTEIGIEVTDVPDKPQQIVRPKQLVLKTLQMSTVKQNVFQSIMELLDTVTVVFKVIEPQLSRIVSRQIDMSEDTHKRINHYMRIFKNCYRCVYRLDER